jgi:hydrogenase-4 component B
VVFLGAPRSEVARQAHESGLAMRGPMLAMGAGCLAIGLAPVLFWPALARASAAWRPAWSGAEAPAPLGTLGWFHVALAALVLLACGWLWHKTRRAGLERAVTWDCGYAAPTARMQYTSGSFAGIITEWFAWLLRPVRHEQRPEETFPAKASLTEHTPETVLEYVVEPAGGTVMKLALATRRLQHGRVQAYLLYVLLGAGAITLLVLWGGAE